MTAGRLDMVTFAPLYYIFGSKSAVTHYWSVDVCKMSIQPLGTFFLILIIFCLLSFHFSWRILDG